MVGFLFGLHVSSTGLNLRFPTGRLKWSAGRCDLDKRYTEIILHFTFVLYKNKYDLSNMYHIICSVWKKVITNKIFTCYTRVHVIKCILALFSRSLSLFL